METIERINSETIRIDGAYYFKEVPKTKKPEKNLTFKVGQWAAFEVEGCEKCIFRITRFERDHVYGDICDQAIDLTEHSICLVSSLLPVTPADIESHLWKICDARYIGRRVKCLDIGEHIITGREHNEGFVEEYDQFWMIGNNGDGVLVYERGKFAEILPDKKPLPTTKEGISGLIELYHDQNDGLPFKTPIDEFLRDYED